MHAREQSAPARRPLGARDRRFGEKWTLAQTTKNAVIRAAVAVALSVVDRLPARVLLALGELAGHVTARLARAALREASDRVALSSLDVAPDETARAAFANAGRNAALCALLRREAFRARDEVVVSDAALSVLRGALAEGRGALVVSAHLGPFELIPAALVEAGLAPSIVVRESYDPALDPVVDAHRRRRGIEVIHRGQPFAARRVLRALGRGCPVGVLPDLVGRGVPAEPVEFLGRSTPFPVGLERLARAARCPILVGTLTPAPSGARFELVIERIEHLAGASLTQRVADGVARAIVRCPEQWLWMAARHLSIAGARRGSLSSEIPPSSELGRA